MTVTTRTPASPPPPADSPADLLLSPEVRWYLEDRGYPLPDCPPKFKTPEPGETLPGARFDPARVDHVVRVFKTLRHTQGRWAGQELAPDPWQIAYVLAPVFGWEHYDEEAGAWVRVITTLYVDVPRKNGKSTMIGGIATYMAFADGEAGAQVVTAATSKDQASFVFAPLKVIAERSPALAKHVKVYAHKITKPADGSYVQVVSSAPEAQHGANIHCGVIDELHIHKTADLVEAIETGTGSRTQPLIATITTADTGRQHTIYDRKRRRVEQLAHRTIDDPTTYGVVWAAEKTDDPFVEATWRKANPGLGVSPSLRYLEKASKEAQQSPADLAKFLRLHLGIRTNQETRYLDLNAWDRSAGLVDEAKLAKRECYGGLDLAATSDLTSWCLVFPSDDEQEVATADGYVEFKDGTYDVIWRHWVPERAYEELNKRTAGEASVWRREGLLTVTPGDVTDYDFVRTAVLADHERFEVMEVAYDPWNASHLVNELQAEGVRLAKVRQGFVSISAPTKELQRLVLGSTPEFPRLRHGGNPLLRWQVDNFAVATDAAGNVKPDKGEAGDKIDGVVALIMALDRAINRPRTVSAYEPERRAQ